MTPITPSQLQEWKALASRSGVGATYGLANDKFLAAAREAIPALCAEIESLQTLVGGLQSDNHNLHREVEGLRLERDALRDAAKQAREIVAASNIRYCQWCGDIEPYGHDAACPRQLALAALDAVLEAK